MIIDESYPSGQTLASIKTLYGLDSVAPSDLPNAFATGRVYTLDGTMDSTGAPYGGTDFYESRIAEPDALLADIIATVHAASPNYAPTGMTHLRHASTGSVRQITASMCTDASAPREVRAATCEALATTNDAVLGWLSALDGFRSPPPPPPASSSDAALIAVIIALGVGVVIFGAIAVYFYSKLKATSKKAVAPA
jgi:hypothetical protein